MQYFTIHDFLLRVLLPGSKTMSNCNVIVVYLHFD
jgi:hypothetical protein